MQNLKQVDDQLNEMTSAGQILEALERFYSEDCTFQEGNKDPMIGRQAHHDHLTEFFSTLKEFKGATLHSQGVGENATLTEWTFDMVGPDGPMVGTKSCAANGRTARSFRSATTPPTRAGRRPFRDPTRGNRVRFLNRFDFRGLITPAVRIAHLQNKGERDMRSLKQVNDRLNEMARLGRILDSSQTQKERDMYTNRTKSKRFALCATVAALLLMLTMPVPAQAESHEKSLYDRLGGYDAVSAVVDDFAAKLFVDEQVGKFFVGMGTDTREQFRQKNKNLVCNVTGGPCKIISRSAKVVHGGLGITESDFNVVANHLGDTLNKLNVPEKEQKELFAIIDTLKDDIVD